MSETAAYDVPEGPLSLSGPVDRPPAGTLPIRGDLAHIALARTYLVAHYVIPQQGRITGKPASVHLAPSADSQSVARLEIGAEVEILDYSGKWCWICLGPKGPSGYILQSELEPEAASEEPA
ncbi:MAG: hypothetical protein ACK5NN_07800 [Sphingomonadaceae bacterium]